MSEDEYLQQTAFYFILAIWLIHGVFSVLVDMANEKILRSQRYVETWPTTNLDRIFMIVLGFISFYAVSSRYDAIQQNIAKNGRYMPKFRPFR